MIDRKAFLADAQKLVVRLEKDLRARCDDMPEVGQAVAAEYRKAKDAGRTGHTLEAWRADAITQQAVAWVLSCVFVRFLEDNTLLDPPKLAGPGERLNRARDEHDLYFQTHTASEFTTREYLLSVFDDLAKRPGTRDLYGEHNPIRQFPGWLSPDAAKDMILPFFQRIDAGSGLLVHDFTDSSLDTRFLGDLYQDLSKAARKKYALLQTPVFVEEFILSRTLDPAVESFGLVKVKMIDPACGSGHFLLGGFHRLLALWQEKEPNTPRRDLIQRALDAIHGVDLNPYAVAIARFRLLLAAWEAAGVTSLRNAPDFKLNLTCGDSLLHGGRAVQATLDDTLFRHTYQPEDPAELERLLRPGTYHAVVANPPYITPKDRGQNEQYRKLYPKVCSGKYSLAVPFMQRIFNLACDGGYTGQITANSFMRREFGKKLIEQFFPTSDITHVIDTSGAYIPGHGTPTVILFGRNRKWLASTIRAVMGIRGEPSTPSDPSQGQVWTAILQQIDQPGSLSVFVSVADSPRDSFHKHPWSIGGGGASELKEQLDNVATRLEGVVESVGFMAITGEDDVFILPEHVVTRERLPSRPFCTGDMVRDWIIETGERTVFPYDSASPELSSWQSSQVPHLIRFLWPLRVPLQKRSMFGKSVEEHGFRWFEFMQFIRERVKAEHLLSFGEVASHNHFVLNRGNMVFKQTAPVVKLLTTASESDYLALLGLLNSSSTCFYLKQICHQKQMTGGDGVRVESRAKVPYALAGTSVGRLPIPDAWKAGPLRDRLVKVTREIDTLSQLLGILTASRAIEKGLAEQTEVETVWNGIMEERQRVRSRMIVLQEEIDFTVYAMFGLADEQLLCDPAKLPIAALDAGSRPFDIRCGSNEDGFPVPATIPADWPEALRLLWRKRMDAIKDSPDLRLIEDPHYKRRWIGRQGLFNQTKRSNELLLACKGWLLNRLESYFDFDGRLNDEGQPTVKADLSLLPVAKLADIAAKDSPFRTVGELYREGRSDFDVTKLVAELVGAESVPLLPVLRYKPTGMDKRRAWERTWDLQRREDAIDARVAGKSVEIGAGGWTPQTDDGISLLNPPQAKLLKQYLIDPDNPQSIPKPPEYKPADFQKPDYWRLRKSLDVPKERWISFPHCEGADGLPLVAWAGYDHLQLAKAIADHYVLIKEQEGGRDDLRLVPLLAAITHLIPWLKQWHNEVDEAFNVRMGDYYEDFVQGEAREMGKTVDEIRGWQPPGPLPGGRVRRRR